MLINGDDILARTDAVGVARWRLATAAGGLSESIGKTYISSEFCNINSRCYTRAFGPAPPGKIHASPLQEVKVLNLGLMYGMKRGGGQLGADDEHSSREGSLGSRAKALIAGWTPEQQVHLMDRFVAGNREQLPGGAIPWFISEACGGVGLPETTKHYPDRRNRAMASAIMKGLVKPPCSLVAREIDTATTCYQNALSAVEGRFGVGSEDYGGDRLAAELAMSSYVFGKFNVVESACTDSRVKKLSAFWNELGYDGITSNPDDYSPAWTAPRSFLACQLVC